MSILHIECLESRIDKPREHYGQFAISPLTPSQSITVGNALRRTLLSDLPGTAIVSVRIAGINHEFSIIPGVREDVLEILLNLKSLVFKASITTPQVGKVRVQGPGIVTAGLLELPSGVELVDPRQYIATICNNSIFELEFCLETNIGYRIIQKGVSDIGADFIQIDAKFMPVEKANFQIPDASPDHSKNKERLILEAWTNGSISPQEAVSQSASILTNLFGSLKHLDFSYQAEESLYEEQKISQISIEELHLSVRAYNCLKRAQIHSVVDLLNYSPEELLEIKNFGQKSVEEVIEALHKRLGIRLTSEKQNHSIEHE